MVKYSAAQNKIEFSGKLFDSINPYDAKPIPIPDNSDVYVWMKAPNGKEYIRVATLDDSDNISYITEDTFPQLGDWRWTVGAEFHEWHQDKESKNTNILGGIDAHCQKKCGRFLAL